MRKSIRNCLRALIAATMWLAFFPPPASSQPLPCFKEVPAPPWEGTDIGILQTSSSRPLERDGYELCSLSAGFGDRSDDLRFLSQSVRANFEMRARLVQLSETGGLGGVMARLDNRTEHFPYMAIYVRRQIGGGMALQSSYRLNDGDSSETGNSKPVAVQLPIWLKVTREGSKVSTSYSEDGRLFITHLSVDADASGLANFFMAAGMTQGSESRQAPGLAAFTDPSVAMRETDIPPRLFSVDPPSSPVEGGIEVRISGAGLEGAREVQLAGIPAKILSNDGKTLIVDAGASRVPTSGDVLVETPSGSESLMNAFAYIGISFKRGDFDGDNQVELVDAINSLYYMFIGGVFPRCLDALDANGDEEVNIGDPIRVLSYLYLDTPQPPPPYDRPGIGDTPHRPCGLPPRPELLGISKETIQEGDIVTLSGKGFTPDPDMNLVFFGESPARVLKATSDELIVEVGALAQAGRVDVSIFDHFAPYLKDCKFGGCRPSLVGIASKYAAILVNVIPSKVVPVGSGHPEERLPGRIILPIDPQKWDPYETYEVNARLLLPAVYRLSRGNLAASFEFRHQFPRITFAEWLGQLADELQEALDQVANEAKISTDDKRGLIFLDLNPELIRYIDRSWLDSFIGVLIRPPKAKCGPSNFDPELNRREYGWCRFDEITETCNGLPKWEYFIPKHLVLQSSDSITPMPSPNSWSTGQKDAMYNKPAYCHVRSKDLYKRCVLEDMAAEGKTQVPHFPRSAMVVKTRWSTEATLLSQGKDPTKHYSYQPTGGGPRQYLTLFHFTDKSVDDWFWADFYVPSPSGGGGCGGSGADRPASITGVWANYEMCTNLKEDEGGTVCGNNVIGIECVQNCVSCHKDASVFTPSGSIKVDFLHSLKFPIDGPPDCP